MAWAALIIDDNAEVRDVVRSYFEASDLPIHTAASVEEGIALMRKHRIGFVILDLHMPGITGDVALLHIRQEFPKTRVAILSGFLDASLRQQLQDLGAVAFFHKPVSFNELVKEAQLALDFME